jgi:methylenetetrahydrofolate dehydrogenase (NADP+)/methenyltetrahydrofolate cyclohydrolase
VLRILKDKNIELHGKNQLIIGKGRLVGDPLSSLLTNLGCVFQSADISTPVEKLKQMVREADIIYTATGQQDIVEESCFKQGCIIFDVGCSQDHNSPGKVRGDFSEEMKGRVCSFYTPVPRGIGPLTVALLLSNVGKAWKFQCRGKFS